MKPGFLSVATLLAAAASSGAAMAYVPSYGWFGASFDFRTPNQRKRRRLARQLGGPVR